MINLDVEKVITKNRDDIAALNDRHYAQGAQLTVLSHDLQSLTASVKSLTDSVKSLTETVQELKISILLKEKEPPVTISDIARREAPTISLYLKVITILIVLVGLAVEAKIHLLK